MADLYKSMGFTENPFSRFSAEEERRYLERIYIQPRYYSTINKDIKEAASRFIIGERGIGKTALMLKLEYDFAKDNVFAIIVDEYDGIDKCNNQSKLLIKTMESLITKLGVYLLTNKKVLKQLNKIEKEKLTFFINNCFKSLSKEEFDDLYNTTTKYKSKNKLAWIFNSFLLKPLNMSLSSISEWIGTTVSKSLGLPQVSEGFYKMYIPEISITSNTESVDLLKLEYSRIKSLYKVLVEVIIKCGFNNVVVFYDKIDEYQMLGTSITSIADFIKGIATDTSLLQMEHCSFVFVIWSRVKNTLNSVGARFDKFKTIDITWTDEELQKIINKRLSFFAEKTVELEMILEDKAKVNELISLAYKSPRHMLMLLSRIYDEQETINSKCTYFSNEAIEQGIDNYAKNFDFPSLYPGEKGKKSYIVSVVNRLLKVSLLEFQSSDLVSVFKVSSQSANNDIKIMREYGLIIELDNERGQSKRYRIAEPRVEYLINNGIKKLDLQE